jgi:hypothetical protein
MGEMRYLGATTIAGIDKAEFTQALQVVLVDVDAFTLCVGRVRASTVWSLIPVETEPVQVVEHTLCSTWTHARTVKVLDAQYELTIAATRKEPGE